MAASKQSLNSFCDKIEIHSLESIEERAKFPFAPKTILISMGDAGTKPPRLTNKPDHILRLTFDDMTLAEVKTELNLPESVTSSDETLIEYLLARNIHMFSDEQARQITAFILQHSDTDVLICQCRYGQSRSAGCAAAVAEYFYGNGIDIFADDRFYPNKLVYKKVVRALEECEKEP